MLVNKQKATEMLEKAKTVQLSEDEISSLVKFATNMGGWAGDTSFLEECHKLGFDNMADVPSNFDEYTDLINDFPVHVQSMAGIFFRTFTIPEGAIPRPKNRSKFSEWILQLNYLNKVGGFADIQEAMDKTFKKYQVSNFPVARPSAINSYFTDSVAEVLRERKSKQQSAGKNSDRLTSRDAVSDIGSMFDEDSI